MTKLVPEEVLWRRLGVRGRLILHPGLKGLHGKGRVCDVRQGYAQIHYISADPEGNGRIILSAQEPHHRAVGELLVDDAIAIRATLERRCTFFVACVTPDWPTVMRATPLHFTDTLSVCHLCGQLAHPGQPITILYRLDRTTKGGIHLAGAYLRTKDFGLQ